MFSTRVRLWGVAIGTQIGLAIGGFAAVVAAEPVVGTVLQRSGGERVLSTFLLPPPPAGGRPALSVMRQSR